MENHTNFATSSEVQDCLNEVLTEVWDLVVAASPTDYYQSDFTITTSSGIDLYSLPSDFYKLRAVFKDEGDGELRPLASINEQEQQYFRPPAGVYTIVVRYIPVSPLLTSDSTTFDGVNGWEELVVLGTAIKLLTKEAANLMLLQLLQAERARVEKRIMDMADRNLGEPERVLRRSLRYRDTFRAFQNTVDTYRLRAGNIQLLRTAGGYLI